MIEKCMVENEHNLNLIDTVNETNLLQKADESWITWMKATFAGVVAPGGDRE
jgi:hypothetical protein